MTDITFKQVDHDLGILHQQTVALEGFQRWVVGNGVVTGDTARVIRVALEDSESDVSKGVTGKDLVTGIKKVSVTLRNIIQWILRQIGKLIEKIGLGLQKLGNLGRDNEKKLKALSNDSVALLDSGEAEITAEQFNPSSLCIAGKFVGNELEHAKQFTTVARWYAKDYMEQVGQAITKIEALISQHLSDETPDAFLKAAGAALASTIQLPKIKMGGSAQPADMELTDQVHSMPLFGDVGLVIFDPSKASAVFEQGIDKIRDYLVMDFVDFNSRQETEFAQLPAPKLPVLIQLNKEMLEAVEFWEQNVNSSANRLKDVFAKVETATGKLGTEDATAAAATMGNAMGVIMQRLGQGIDEGSKYLARTFNHELHYISTTIDIVSQGKKK